MHSRRQRRRRTLMRQRNFDPYRPRRAKNKMSVGDRLRSIRADLGLTQGAMAATVGLGAASWKRLELEDRSPKGEVLSRLAELGVDLNWLLTGQGEMRRLGAAGSAQDWVRELEEVERLVEDEEFPITPEIRRRRPELDAAHQTVVRIARRHDVPQDVRARADLMLDIGFGDSAAAQRRENQYDDTAARLREAASMVREVESRAGWQLPRNVAMALRDMVFLTGVSDDQVLYLVEAMKTDFAAADSSKPK